MSFLITENITDIYSYSNYISKITILLKKKLQYDITCCQYLKKVKPCYYTYILR